MGHFSFELANRQLDNASQKLANHLPANEEKIKAMRVMAGFSWNQKAPRQVKSDGPPVIMRSDIRDPQTKEFGKALGSSLHAAWFALPELLVGNPLKGWRLIATSGLSSRASEEEWDKLFTELGGRLCGARSRSVPIGPAIFRTTANLTVY